MAKASTLDQLRERWGAEKKAKHTRCFKAAGSPSPDRWKEIARVHNRRVIRSGGLNRAGWVAMWLDDLQLWALIAHTNRSTPYPVLRVGNSGKAREIFEVQK